MSRLSSYFAKSKLIRTLFKQPTIPRAAVESEGVFRGPGGQKVRVAVHHFENEPRVSSKALLRVEFINAGSSTIQPLQLQLIWTVQLASAEQSLRLEQNALTLETLGPHESIVESVSVAVPVNAPYNVSIAFNIFSGSETWTPIAGDVRIERHVLGQQAHQADTGFSYIKAYQAADLEKDYWTIVGPASRDEHEMLGRGKRDTLVAHGLTSHSKILDIGCGTGQLTDALVPLLGSTGTYYGIDIGAQAIEFCRKRFVMPNFHFAVNGQTEIPISGIQFDVIYLGSVFTHMTPDEINPMLGEMRRLIEDTGFVHVDAFVSPQVDGYLGSQGMIILNEDDLLALFGANGFRWKEIGQINWNEDCRRVIYHLTTVSSKATS